METGRILVVRGYPDPESVISPLRQAGHSVVEAATVPEALRWIANAECDLVLLPAGLSAEAAHELCCRSHQNDHDSGAAIRVLQICAGTSPHERVAGLRGGADACVATPFAAEELLAQVRLFLRLRHAERLLHHTAQEHKSAQDALRLAEQRFCLAFIGGRAGAWEIDLDTGHMTWARGMAALLGVPDDQTATIAERWLDFIHPQDRDRIHHECQAILRGDTEHWSTAFRVVRPDGSVRWLSSQASVVALRPGQRKLIGIDQDITAIKEAEEKTLASQGRLYFSLETSQTGAWDLDLVDHTANRSLQHDRIFGYCQLVSHWTYESFLEHVIEPDRPAVDAAFRQAIADQRDWNFECRIRRVDGEIRWIAASGRHFLDRDGQPRHMAGIVQDITRRKQAEEALRGNEKLFRTFVRECPDGIIMLDGEGRIVEWNEGEETLTGIPRGEVMGRPLWEIQYQLAPSDQRSHAFLAAAREKILRGLQEGVQLKRVLEDVIQRPDGTRRIIHSVLFAIPKGHEIRACGVCRDITERKQFEGQLECQVAERTARLEELVGELEHFSYTITHDMRAPLRSVRGFSELVHKLCAACPQTEQKSLLKRIIASAERMDLLITDALRYSKAVRHDLPLKPVDVGALVRSMLDSYPEFQTANAQVELPADLPLVCGNHAALTQCFSNLLSNAIKFVKPGAQPHIRIWAELIALPPITHRTSAPPEATEPPASPQFTTTWVRLWIEDDGLGIPERMLPRVFNMFAQGTHELGGTGIGLALVRKVVHRMRGRVGVESELGKGSRFWIELQAGDPCQPLTQVPPSPAPDATTIL